jgi:hypothetical protein
VTSEVEPVLPSVTDTRAMIKRLRLRKVRLADNALETAVSAVRAVANGFDHSMRIGRPWPSRLSTYDIDNWFSDLNQHAALRASWREPVIEPQAGDVSEVSDVMRYKCQAVDKSDSGNHHVGFADRRPLPQQCSTPFSILFCTSSIEGEDRHIVKQVIVDEL